MQSRTRNVWIIVLLVLAALCCCAVLAIAAVFGWVTNWSFDYTEIERWGVARFTDEEVQTFEVGASPSLEVESFAGNIVVRQGTEGVIQVTATRHAPRTTSLNQIDIQYEETSAGLHITSQLRRSGLSNTYVEFDIAVPADTNLILDLGAGAVDISGGGGSARVKLGAGTIEYNGEPEGDCRFETGAGEIVLRLPADLNAEVDLDTGIGEVDITGFQVAGQVTRGRAVGTIGRGGDLSIYAHTGAGRVELRSR